MTSEKLLEYIGQIDDRYIAEVDFPVDKSSSGTRIRWFKLMAVAAAVVCVASAALVFLQNVVFNIHTNLPKLTVDTEFGNMGFEGYLAYNIGELQDGNPWTEKNNLKTMPVFENPWEYGSIGEIINGLTEEEMSAKAREVAGKLGYDIISLSTKNLDYTIPYSVVAECSGVKIEVLDDGKITLYLTPEKGDFSTEINKLKDYDNFSISFEGYGSEKIDGTTYQYGLPLPDGYRFVYDNMTYDEALKTTKYLFSKYGAFSGIKSPGYNLFAHYTYSGDFGRLYTTVFENKGSLKQRILNYHFDNLSFSPTDLGGLGGISREKHDLSRKIGDYPIITAAKARKLLLKGHYITSVPEELPGEEYIARVTLVYRTSRRDKVIMPYYKFFVEMPSMKLENGLKTFGAFYVPAVKGEFLENMPLWDGSIN